MDPSSTCRVTQQIFTGSSLIKRINADKDVIYFKKQSPAYKNIIKYIDLLCETIRGTGNKVFNHNYVYQDNIFKRCSIFLDDLAKRCEETDLTLAKGANSLRFGHVAFRDWFDQMKELCKEFVGEIAANQNEQYKEELSTYLSESFGNKMRIDYGTGHEMNFIIFSMGLSNLVSSSSGDDPNSVLTEEKLKSFVQAHGWDIHWLFAQSYLNLCRKVQIKFRLEPAGSKGVYNMDDFQYLPFLFGAAQLMGSRHITSSEFYLENEVAQYTDDYIFFKALDFILNNKRGPFNEHSYTLWTYTNLGSWDNIFRRIRFKFTDDILGPFPIIQHFLFGQYILRWSD